MSINKRLKIAIKKRLTGNLRKDILFLRKLNRHFGNIKIINLKN